MASQGSLLIYLVLVFIYAKLINKLDAEYIEKNNK
jgi:putative solute:sodium symporter small subunit